MTSPLSARSGPTRLSVLAVAAALVAALALARPAPAETAAPPAEPAMTFDRLAEIAAAVDPDFTRQGNLIQLDVGELPVLIVADPAADRMRAMLPIRSTEGVPAEELMRLMQANFDTALDARYAVAQGRIWSVFIHPLSPLGKNELLSGLGQVVNLATSYGTLYSSGALSFGGGDSGALQRKLIDDLIKKGEKI